MEADTGHFDLRLVTYDLQLRLMTCVFGICGSKGGGDRGSGSPGKLQKYRVP